MLDDGGEGGEAVSARWGGDGGCGFQEHGLKVVVAVLDGGDTDW